MNKSTVVFLLNDEVRAIKGIYEPAPPGHPNVVKPMLFKTFDQDIEVDDYLVVESDTRHKMTTVQVTEVDVDVDVESDVKVHWVIGKIDMDPYEQTLKDEAEAIKAVNAAAKRKKRDEVRANMFKDDDERIAGLKLATPLTKE